jgi:MFS superfamily sulfate permease-like transporter
MSVRVVKGSRVVVDSEKIKLYKVGLFLVIAIFIAFWKWRFDGKLGTLTVLLAFHVASSSLKQRKKFKVIQLHNHVHHHHHHPPSRITAATNLIIPFAVIILIIIALPLILTNCY